MDITADELAALRGAADRGRTLNYSPYSGFVVLAAARVASGAIGTGSNVENVNFSLTKHAEEVAILNAFQVGRDAPGPGTLEVVYVAGAMPCGGCRQFALEFGRSDSLWVVDLFEQELLREATLLELADGMQTTTMTFAEALPSAFDAAVPGIRRAGEAWRRAPAG